MHPGNLRVYRENYYDFLSLFLIGIGIGIGIGMPLPVRSRDVSNTGCRAGNVWATRAKKAENGLKKEEKPVYKVEEARTERNVATNKRIFHDNL